MVLSRAPNYWDHDTSSPCRTLIHHCNCALASMQAGAQSEFREWAVWHKRCDDWGGMPASAAFAPVNLRDSEVYSVCQWIMWKRFTHIYMREAPSQLIFRFFSKHFSWFLIQGFYRQNGRGVQYILYCTLINWIKCDEMHDLPRACYSLYHLIYLVLLFLTKR